MQLTSEQALDLSQRFRALSVTLRDFRFSHWDELLPAQREAVENSEWSLLNDSSDMITEAVGLALDESETSFLRLQDSTEKAGDALKSLKQIQAIIDVAAAAVGLAGAIISRDPVAVGKSLAAVYAVVAPLRS